MRAISLGGSVCVPPIGKREKYLPGTSDTTNPSLAPNSISYKKETDSNYILLLSRTSRADVVRNVHIQSSPSPEIMRQTMSSLMFIFY